MLKALKRFGRNGHWRLVLLFLIFILILMMLAPVYGGVRIYTLSTLPVYSSNPVERINLDAGDMMVEQLNVGLPNDMEQAIDIARNRLTAENTDAMQSAFTGVFEAWELGIERLPAIVIDDTYVIYGMNDVDQALSIAENRRSNASALHRSNTETTQTATETDSEHTNSGETINSAKIATESINFSCLDFEIVGVCIWITYLYYTVEIDYSIKVRHYIPDAVVSAYQNTGENPWTDVASYSEPIDGLAENGGTNKEGNKIGPSHTQQEKAQLFKNVDVIGSPGMAWIEELSEDEDSYFCKPAMEMFYPYMLSTLDPMWRDPTLETFSTIANWNRYAQSGQSKWGPIFPRHGFINQGHDYKAGAVIAQRAGDITTREDQLHVYIPMIWEAEGDENVTMQGYWPPSELIEGDQSTGWWQQLIPSSESDECRVFADKSDQTSGASDPFEDRVNDPAGYAFNLWRDYECCSTAGAILLTSIGGEE